ncbi:uncharacterized protein [Apostichopus japonicus]
MNMESRRRRRHIPPSKLKERHPQNTEALLQQKLDVAENETGNLMKQLSMLGFVPEKMSRDTDRSSKDKSESMTPISPYTVSKNVVVDPQRLHKSYEVLVTRVCKAESQIQTLKLNLCTLQAEKDIYGTEADKVRDQLVAQEEKHEENEKKLKSVLDDCKRDLERALNERRTTEEEMVKIKEELSRLAKIQTETSDVSNGLEEDKVNNQRLTRKLSELTTELSHEVDLRKSLEDSHFTLLQRIKDTEGIVEGERRETQKLVNVYTKLTDEKEKLREEKNQLEFILNPLKEKIKKLSAELGMRDIRLAEALRENQVAVAAADGMKRQRAELQQELENLTEKYKTLSAEREKNTLSDLREIANVEMEEANSQLAAARMEIDALKRENQTLEAEKMRLEERISAVGEQEVIHQKVGSSIAHLMEDKKRLAYEKGQLQERVNALQREVEDSVRTITENKHLRKTKSNLESQVKKINEDLTAAQVLVHQLQSQIRQEQNTSEMKERDFEIAIKARDAAVKETERLSRKLEERGYQEQIKVSGLQKSLADVQADHSKMAAMLDSVMGSHHNLQSQMESLQTELGRKDRELTSARQERENNQRILQHLQDNVQRSQDEEKNKEHKTIAKVRSIQRELSSTQEDNHKMGDALEELSGTNSQLQAALGNLQEELQRQKRENQILREKKETEKVDSEYQAETLRERINSLQSQLITQKSLVNKQAQKELVSLRRAHGEMATRVSDLSKTNTELNEKVTKLLEAQTKLQDRVKRQKAQSEGYRPLREANAALTQDNDSLRNRLADFQELKRSYGKRNKEQTTTIGAFVKQVKQLQKEIEETSQKSEDYRRTKLANDGDNRLQQENVSLKAKLTEAELHNSKLEMKLAEFSAESDEISSHIQDANSWFQKKYTGLQRELGEATKEQGSLREVVKEQARELRQEKFKSDEQTQRAYQIIRSSRVALGRLTGELEKDKIESKSQMQFLARRVQAERDHSSYMEKKYNNMLD